MRPAIFPFYDMVCWIISHTSASNCNIINSCGQFVGSFRPELFGKMYKFPPAQIKADNDFQEQFKRELKAKDLSLSDAACDWWVNITLLN